MILLLVSPLTTLASLYGFVPEARFGAYGIQHFSTMNEYKSHYEGQTVIYIPADGRNNDGSGSSVDKKFFLDIGGKFNTEYVISKISGNDSKMTFLLIEKEGKNKVKMIVNNPENEIKRPKEAYEDISYYITDTYSIPLLLSDKFNEDRNKTKNERITYPQNQNSTVYYEVQDMVMKSMERDNKIYTGGGYPVPCYLLVNTNTGEQMYYDLDHIEDLNDIGTVFTNPQFKCSYSVIKVSGQTNLWTYKHTKEYVVQNSISGITKIVFADKAESMSFTGDDDGRFWATLESVEKPSDPNIRFGESKTITEDGVTKYSYADNVIDIVIFGGSSQFDFVLKNVSDNTIKLVWNEAVFVDVNGSTSKVMHSGIKYSQKEGDQPASTIIKGAALEDVAVPTEKVYYDEKRKEWTKESLYSKAKIQGEKQTLRLMLPIQIKEVINEYIFEFSLSYKYDHPEYLFEE